MSNLSTQLKTWGAQGSEYPDGYNYLEDEEPVDAWDNFFSYHAIEDIHALIDVVNGRLESEAASSYPSSPEVGHLVHRTDAPENGAHEELYYHDGSTSTWSRILRADGDTMSGPLDMGGNEIRDSSGTLSVATDADVAGSLAVDGARLDHRWFSKQEGGTVTAGNSVVLVTAELADGETFYVTQGHLSQDGWNTPAASGVDLIVAADGSGKQATVFSGDGSTFHEGNGEPLASYTNTTGSPQQVAVLIDNGEFGTGAGEDVKAYGGTIARVA